MIINQPLIMYKQLKDLRESVNNLSNILIGVKENQNEILSLISQLKSSHINTEILDNTVAVKYEDDPFVLLEEVLLTGIYYA